MIVRILICTCTYMYVYVIRTASYSSFSTCFFLSPFSFPLLVCCIHVHVCARTTCTFTCTCMQHTGSGNEIKEKGERKKQVEKEE